MSNEYKILCNSDTLIISFASMGQLINNHKVQFEFVNYLTNNYNNKADFYFFMDPEKVHYHRGIPGITSSIQETVEYLNNIIHKGNYKKVIYMGVSSGGYAAILFGSLCHVNTVIAFTPQTKLTTFINLRYKDLIYYINSKTKYILYGNTSIKNKNNCHHISHCNRFRKFKNITIFKPTGFSIKKFRDGGDLTRLLNKIMNETN